MTGVQTCALPICFPVTICQGVIVVAGKSKAGKSNIVNCLIAASLSGVPTLQFSADLDGRKVVLFDTEQTMTQLASNVKYKILRYTGLTAQEFNRKFDAFSLMRFAPYDRLAYIEQILERLAPNKNEIGLVVIDGIRDLLYDSNDNKEADALLQKIMQLTQKYGCIIATVIHTNEGDGKLQGHLGKGLGRKATNVIQVLRDDMESSQREIRCTAARIDNEFPAFHWYLNDKGHPTLTPNGALPTDNNTFDGYLNTNVS